MKKKRNVNWMLAFSAAKKVSLHSWIQERFLTVYHETSSVLGVGIYTNLLHGFGSPRRWTEQR